MADLTIGRVPKNIGTTQIGDSIITDTGTSIAVAGPVTLSGSTSGGVALRVPAIAGSSTITFPAGSTDFSATGGAGHVLQQSAAGAPITVAALSPGSIGGLGAGVATWLATPSSANLLAAVTDETGTGSLVFATSPTLLGNPTAPTPATSDDDTSIATTAFVKAQNYIAGNQSITLSGDIAGTGTTAIATTLPTVLLTPGTFQGLTINGKGLVTAAANQNYATTAALAGYLPLTGGNLTGPGWLGIGGAPAALLHLATQNLSAAAWTTNGLGLRAGAGTWTDTSSTGTVAETAAHSFLGPTLAASSATVYSQAETVRIAPPAAGTNATITLAFALAVAGNLIVSSTAGVSSYLQTAVGNANDAEFIIQKSRSGGVITSADELGTIRMRGHDGTSYVDGATILARSSGTIATGALNATLQLTTNGTARMTLGPGAAVGLTGNTSPQAMLSIGNLNATVRSYQSFTDAANGSWCYLGDYGKTAFVATVGTEANGAGTVRPLALMSGGIEAVRFSIAGETSYNTTTATALHTIGGTYTTSTNKLLQLTTAFTSAITGNLFVCQLSPTLAFSGASLGVCYNFFVDPIIAATAVPVTSFWSSVIRGSIAAGSTTVPATMVGLNIIEPLLNGNAPIPNYVGLNSSLITNGNGLAAGAVTNRGILINQITAGSAGGTIINRAAQIITPSGGSSSGSTTNNGLYLTGNGGTAAGGTVTNYAIYSDSTAPSFFSGPVIQRPAASVVPVNNGELTVEATSNTSLTFRFKGSDGTVRAAALTLA